jgi:hypothetical protein
MNRKKQSPALQTLGMLIVLLILAAFLYAIGSLLLPGLWGAWS